MKFYQLSDLHLHDGTEWDVIKQKYEEFCSRLRKTHAVNDSILLIITGDVIEGGRQNGFSMARRALEFIKDSLSGFQIQYEFLPGNHDLCDNSLKDFDQFTRRYQENTLPFNECSVHTRIYGNVNFIFVDSVPHRDYRLAGKLDAQKIKSVVKLGMENLLFLHHGFVMEDGDEHTDCNHSFTVALELERMGIGCVFYGHTHAGHLYYCNSLPLIGCGAFSKDLGDMPCVFNQYLLGEIREGKLVGVVRYLYIADSNIYLPQQVYPRASEDYCDPLKVQKIVIEPASNYIPRKLWLHKDAVSEVWERVFAPDRRVTTLQAVLDNNKILLLGDAGTGKSVELQQLAYLLSNNFAYFPVWVSLKNYTGKPIEQLLPSQYQSYRLNPLQLFWIFDGFDELDTQQCNSFRKMLRAYVEEHQGVRILISARSNFCKAEVENESLTFSGFTVFNLCNLDEEDITDYLIAKQIDPLHFREVLVVKSLRGFEQIPFYLVKLVELFMQSDGQLPARVDLMDTLVSQSFDLDTNKYDEKADGRLDEQQADLFQALEEVAFSMQLLQQIVLPDKDFQQLFLAPTYTLLKHSALLTKTKDCWQFAHNNFREYLVARMLASMSQEQAISYFTLSDQTIKPNWVNTLSYLVGLKLEWDIQGWLIEHSPNALVKFEPDRVSEEMRFHVLKNLFETYEVKQIWFHDPLCNEQELAAFSQSRQCISFLLGKILKSPHFFAQHMALGILLHITDHFGLQNEIREALMTCCRAYPRTRATECRIALAALAKLHLDTDQTTVELYSMFSPSDEDYIRLGMYEYLNYTNRQDAYVEYYLSGLLLIASRSDRVINESIGLVQGLKKMSKSESLEMILNWWCSEESKIYFYHNQEIFEANCLAAALLYEKGEQQFYNVLLQCFLFVAKQGWHDMERSVIGFFKQICAEKAFSLEVAHICWIEYELYYLDVLFSELPGIIDMFAGRYSDDTLLESALFPAVVRRYVSDGPQYNAYVKLIRTKNDIPLERPERIDYHAERKIGQQQFFDMLFDPKLAKFVIAELLSEYQNPQLTFKELKEAQTPYDWQKRHPAAEILYWEICRSSFKTSNALVSAFFQLIDWNFFTIRQAYELLKKEGAIEVSSQQVNELKHIFHLLVEKGVFSTTNADGSVGYYTMASLFLLLRFNFSISEATLLDLIKQPEWLFSEAFDSQEKYVFLEKRLSREKISQHVTENLLNRRVTGSVRDDHFRYCKQHRIWEVESVAIRLCRNVGVAWQQKRAALEYLCGMEDSAFVCEKVLLCASTEMLLYLSSLYQKNPPMGLVKKLEERCKSKVNKPYIAILIHMGSEHAITCYLEVIRKRNTTPDGFHDVDGPTESIATINDVSMLPLLKELIDVLFQPNFRDHRFRGLYSSLIKALENCAQTDYDATLTMVEQIKKSHTDCFELITFCNHTLEQIQNNHRYAEDCPLSLTQVKALLSFLSH